MRRLLWVNLILALSSLTALAAGTSNSNTTTTDTPPALIVRPLSEPPLARPAVGMTSSESNSETLTLHRSGEIKDWRFSAGPGMVVYGGDLASTTNSGSVGYAMNMTAMTRLANYDSIWVGIDFGINSWTFDSIPGANLSAVGLQMLASVVYQFPSVIIKEIQPFIGLSAGPYVYVAKTPAGNPSTLYLEALLRPGILYQATSELAFGFEPKFGILGVSLVFAPQLSVNLSL